MPVALIRSEQPSDADEIAKLLIQAFGSSDESSLVEELRNSNDFIQDMSIVLIEGGLIAGYLLLYPVKIRHNQQETPSLALAPMAVLPDKQKQGLGSALVREGIARAKSAGWGSIIVVGHPEYYPRFGFKPASQWKLTSPFELPPEVFMALELQEQAIISNGYVAYPDPFLDLES